MSQLPKIKAIITDWDDTITDKDTIQLVAEAAYITKPDFPTKWDHLSDVYYSKYKEFIQDFGDRSTIKDERRYQTGLKQIELSSVSECVTLKLFKGVTHDTLERQSEKVDIKDGFFKVFRKVYDAKIPVYILSCNWTSVIMKKIFNDAGFHENENLNFLTNEFEHVNGVLTGEVSNHVCIRTGVDKVEQVHKILKKLQERDITDGVFYFGDSATDVLPMLETDYGVVIQNGSAIESLQVLQIPYDEGLQGNAKIKHIMNWHAVNELL